MRRRRLTPVATQSSCEIKAYRVAPDGEHKAYKPGWDYARARQQENELMLISLGYSRPEREQIWANKLSVKNSFKHGLYAKVLQSSNLEFVEFSVTPEDNQRRKEINYTSKLENGDTLKG